MPVTHSYADHGDGCRAANALDVVGDRWTLIIVRELIFGPKRFADLQSAVRGVTPAVLTTRLRALAERGIIERVVLPGSRTPAYAATEWGRGLESVLQALGRWFGSGPDPVTAGGMTPDAVMIAIRTMSPSGAYGAVTLRLYDARTPEIGAREFTTPEAAATVTADSTTWSSILFADLDLEGAEEAGSVTIAGDRRAVLDLIAACRSAG